MKKLLEKIKGLSKKQILAVVVAGLVITLIVMSNMVKAIDVDTEKAQKGVFQGRIELRGKVMLEVKEKVFSRLSGNIKEIRAKEGDNVEAGTVLAQLDVQDIKLAVQKAEEAYNAAKASLEDYKISIRPEEIRQAEAQAQQAAIAVEAAQKDYNYKKDKLEKTRELQKEGGAAIQELKDAELAFSEADSKLKDAVQTLSISKNNLSKLKKGVSEHGIDAAKANAEQAKVQVEELRNNLGRASVYSGMEGTVLARHIEKGEFVQQGTLLYELGDNDSAYVRVDILADDAKKVKVGQKAVITGEVVDDREYEGEIYFMAPRAETTVSSLGVEQQRVEVRIKYDNTAASLKPGYGVDVKIITQEKANAVFVPDKAVFDLEEDEGVFIVKSGKLALKKVLTGIENDDHIEILEGIEEGEEVVVDPDNKLKPGMRVK